MQWLTLAQARKSLATRSVGLVWCLNMAADGYCNDDDWISVRLRVMTGTIRGVGASRLFNGVRRWRKYLVNATCGSDQLSGRQFHSRFIWESHPESGPVTSNPARPAYTGVAYPGCM
jgi:hypothetical protein